LDDSAPHIVLTTDARAPWLVYSQRGKEGREHVTAYTSTGLNKKIRQESATDRELFPIYTMVRHFKHYLVARQLIVRTDRALTLLKTMKENDYSVARLYDKVQQ
uniref:RT_RNaseH domain-containing protein n=1 Tax=Taenia asiatica TaxID=60517 RepID=A0A0R3W2L6_TAEAS